MSICSYNLINYYKLYKLFHIIILSHIFNINKYKYYLI